MENRAGLFPMLPGDCEKPGSIPMDFYVDPKCLGAHPNVRAPMVREIDEGVCIALKNGREREQREASGHSARNYPNNGTMKSTSTRSTAATNTGDTKVISVGGEKFVYTDVPDEKITELKRRFDELKNRPATTSNGGSPRDGRFVPKNGRQIPFETYIVDNTDLADPNLQGIAIPVHRSGSHTEYPTVRWGESLQGVDLGIDWYAVLADGIISFVPLYVAGKQVIFTKFSEYSATLFKLTSDGKAWQEKRCTLKSPVLELANVDGKRSAVKLRQGYWLCPLSEFVGVEGMLSVENIVNKRPFSFALGTTLSRKEMMKIFVFDAQNANDLRIWLSCISQAITGVNGLGSSCGLVNGRLVASNLTQSDMEAISRYFSLQTGATPYFQSQGAAERSSLATNGFRPESMCFEPRNSQLSLPPPRLPEEEFGERQPNVESLESGQTAYEGDFVVVDKNGARVFANPGQVPEQRGHLQYGACVVVKKTEEINGNTWRNVGDMGWVRDRLTGQVLSQINYIDPDSKFSSNRVRVKNLGQTFEMYSSPCILEPLPTTVVPGQTLVVLSIGLVKYPDEVTPSKDASRVFYFVSDSDNNMGWLPSLTSKGIDVLEDDLPYE